MPIQQNRRGYLRVGFPLNVLNLEVALAKHFTVGSQPFMIREQDISSGTGVIYRLA